MQPSKLRLLFVFSLACLLATFLASPAQAGGYGDNNSRESGVNEGDLRDLPGQATLLSPNGDIGTIRPTFIWRPVPTATHYYLWVNGPRGMIIKQWYTAVQAHCGLKTCSITPALTLGSGLYQWLIQAHNDSGNGPWSAPMNFRLGTPWGTDLISPEGDLETTEPTFVWQVVPNATYYYLQVEGPYGREIETWYSAAEANCNRLTCSVTPEVIWSFGWHQWWIKTRNDLGDGPWSGPLTFNIPWP